MGSRAIGISLLLASSALAANPYGYTGRSWDDPPLRELFTQADLVAECEVLVGGQFRAIVRPVRVFSRREEIEPQDALVVEGFNCYEWNTAYYTMRAGDVAVLALFTPGGPEPTYTLATPSSGRFPVDRGRVTARLGESDFLVQVPADDFRSGLDAYFLEDGERAAGRLGEMLASDSLETRYLAIVLLGELAGEQDGGVRRAVVGRLTPLARDRNPAVREAAARALGRAGGPEAARVLATFLTDADQMVARAAVEAVVETGSPGAGRELVAWLSRVAVREETRAEEAGDRDPEAPGRDEYRVQGEAFQFLADGAWLEGASGEERAAVTRGLVEMIASGDRGRATLAARVLGLLGVKEAVPGLIRLLGAEDETLGADGTGLREEAAAALVAITLAPEAARRSRALEWWQEHKDEPRRKWVERGLARAADALRAGTYGGDTEGRLLVAVSRSPVAAWAVREKLAEGTGWDDAPFAYMKGPLVAAFAERALASGTSSQRAGAARALASLAEDFEGLFDEALLPALVLATHDTDSEVRAAAIGAMDAGCRPGRPGLAAGRLDAGERLLALLEHGSGKSEKNAAAEALRKSAGRRFGFYVSRGFDLQEELRGLELWKEWAERRGAGSVERPGQDRPPPLVAAREGAPGPSAGPPDGRDLPAELADTDPDVWLGAARLVADAGSTSTERLRGLTKSENARVRAIAAAALGIGGSRSRAGLLTDLLDDPDPMVRVQAAWALGNCLSGEGEPPRRLIEIAREALPEEKAEEPAGAGPHDAGVRPAGAGPHDAGARPAGAGPHDAGVRPAGAGPHDAGVRPAGAGDTEPGGDAGRGTGPSPTVDDPWAGFQIDDPEPQLTVIQAVAVVSLGKIGGPDALDVLREALERGGTELQREAAAALAHFPGEEADGPLMVALGGASSRLRDILLRVLAARKPAGAAGAIARVIAPVDYWDSYTLMDALIEVARPEDSGVLAAFLTPENETASVAAAYALTRDPGKDAAEGLVQALETCTSSARHYAARALMKLGRRHAEGGSPGSGLTAALRVRATRALAEEVGDTEFLNASYAAQALGQVGVPGLPGVADGLFVYRRSWKPQDPRAMGAIVRLAGQRGLRYALGVLEDGTWSDKYYTIQALHHAPTDEVVAKLLGFWRDPESPFQAVAGRSLRRCGKATVRGVVELLAGAGGRSDTALGRRAAWLLGAVGREARTPDVVHAVTEHLVSFVGSGDPILAWLADRELAALTGREQSLGTDSTAGARARAAVRWRELVGSEVGPRPPAVDRPPGAGEAVGDPGGGR